MNTFFGEPWPCELCVQNLQSPVPLGRACAWCEEIFTADDQGLLVDGQPGGTPYHRNCFLRSIVGGVYHLLGQCSCKGGDKAADPEGCTQREAADLAARLYQDIQERYRQREPGEYGRNYSYRLTLDESQRQIVLLALHKLRLERPGWDFALGEIEPQLGGQLDWPAYPPDERVAALKIVADVAAQCMIDLGSNLRSAHEEYMDGRLSHGAYEVVRTRHAALLSALWAAGYTEKHQFFGYPVLVKPDAATTEGTARTQAPAEEVANDGGDQPQ